MRFPFSKTHSCDAVIFMCMDFRFWKLSVEFLQSQGIQSFDIVAFPGAAKMIVENSEGCPAFIGSDISSKLHNCKKLVVINHADCGAYGGRKAFSNISQEKKRHLKDLKESIKILKNKHSNKEIFGVYVNLDKPMEKVTFTRIRPH